MNIEYIPSETIHVQGKYADIVKKYGKDWRISELGNGNGNWKLTKPSNILLDGKLCRDWVLDHYHRRRLDQKLFLKFKEDIENKHINPADITY